MKLIENRIKELEKKNTFGWKTELELFQSIKKSLETDYVKKSDLKKELKLAMEYIYKWVEKTYSDDDIISLYRQGADAVEAEINYFLDNRTNTKRKKLEEYWQNNKDYL